MRKFFIIILTIGVLGSRFIGCGSSSEQADTNGNKEASKSIDSESKEDTTKPDEKSESSEVNKNKEEVSKSKNNAESTNKEEGVIVKDGTIKIPSNLKMLEIDLNYDGGNPLKIKELKNYNSAINDMLYGVIIGKNPQKVGDINGEWGYNTLVTKFDTIKYPNFFEVQEKDMPNLEFGITLKSKDKTMECSVGSYGNYDGITLKNHIDNLTENKGKDSKILSKKQEGNTYTFISEKDGIIEYEYGLMESPESDIPMFMYRYPEKYKDVFNKIIEESKKSFVLTLEFPKEVTDSSNGKNESNKSVTVDEVGLPKVKSEYLQRMAEVDSESEKLDKEYDSDEGSTQIGMNIISGKQAKLYDDELNEIYKYLEENLDKEKFKELEKSEIAWINKKEEKIAEIRKQYEGGTIIPLMVNSEVAKESKERCYYLINNYME